jgi:dTDP-4-amino-4,6-dideoxygalactose transaminase
MKVLPSYGEAGAVLAKRQDFYEKLIALRYLGTVDKEYCYYPSLNAKIDTLQAAMLLVNLKYVDDIISRRIEIARYYSETLGELVGCPSVSQGPDRPSVFFDYTITIDRRDSVQEYLESNGIETKIKHPILMPHQPGYAHLARPNVPVAENAVDHILSIPIHEKLSDSDVEYVADTLKAAL